MRIAARMRSGVMGMCIRRTPTARRMALPIAAAGGTIGIGYGFLPKKPVPQTQENLKEDVRLLKERLA